MLTRAQMEQVIAEGGSVLHEGRLYTRAQDLPNEAALAKGDPEKETAAANAIQQQIADLQAQLSQLQGTSNASTDGRRIAAGGVAGASTGTPQPTSELAPDIAEKLAAAGFTTPESIAAATDDQLLAVDGIGQATLKRLRAAVVKTS